MVSPSRVPNYISPVPSITIQHPTLRLLQDARCAMSTLVKNYNATATGIVGFGVGGGQALSAVASGTPSIEKKKNTRVVCHRDGGKEVQALGCG